VAGAHFPDYAPGPVGSGLPELDTLLGGSLDRGTSAMLLGPAGVGKSTLAAQYVAAAAERGDRAAIYSFDEAQVTWVSRADRLGLGLQGHIEAGRVTVRQVDPAELSPGELAFDVRRAVEAGARIVVIDSLNGYRHAMPEERFLLLHLHELLSYLNQQGVLTILIMAQAGLVGETLESPIDLSYLADTVLLLRYFEAYGEVRKAISLVKRRTGAHDSSVRELSVGDGGVRIGPEIKDFQGVLSGALQYVGGARPAGFAGERGV
jgi:circadian clock protein KaiC